jgi:hypothetical protein
MTMTPECQVRSKEWKRGQSTYHREGAKSQEFSNPYWFAAWHTDAPRPTQRRVVARRRRLLLAGQRFHYGGKDCSLLFVSERVEVEGARARSDAEKL